MKRNGNGPVVAIDIDGTLGNYHAHFLCFAESWYGKPMPNATEINPGIPLHRFMHTSKSTYRQCKLAYRQGGLKRSMPVYAGADQLCKEIRRAGAELWICTTRPYLRLDNIDPDTRHFLRRNRIQYDAVIYGEHKYHDLVRQVSKDRIVCVMDDLPAMCDQAYDIGILPLLRDQPYNRHYIQKVWPASPDLGIAGVSRVATIWRVRDMEQAQYDINMLIRKWKEEHNYA